MADVEEQDDRIDAVATNITSGTQRSVTRRRKKKSMADLVGLELTDIDCDYDVQTGAEIDDPDQELSEVIAECRQVIGVPECSKWSERQHLSHAKWEENRKLMVEALLKQQFLDESLCSNCKNCPAFLNCLNCRYDLLKHKYLCDYCMEDVDPFTPTSLLESHYWPGSMGNVSYIFDEELLAFWDKLKSFMPGASESAFLRSLEDLSKERNREQLTRLHLQNFFKEWKFCDMPVDELQMKDQFQCPSCSIEQHPSHVDGNCKLYRYKGSGKRSRSSYYGNMFFCDNESVDNALQTLYDDPQIGRMPATENGLCGSTFWKAAQNQSQKFAKLDETGIVKISCRHRIAQKALNMFRGELFGYSYFLQKKLFDRGHPAHCEVLFGGLWIQNSGFTPGEEDEQIFSYLSRIGATTKYMLPEHSSETVKIKDEMRQQLAKCLFPVISEMYENWREEAVLNAEDSSKKRKKIRAKISRQSELLKTLVSVHNEKFGQRTSLKIAKISLLSCLRDSFPWRQIPSNEAIDFSREGLDVLFEEQEQYGNSLYETSIKTDDIIKGKIALINRGISYCKSQLQFTCDTFGKCITENAAPEVEIAPISSVAVDIPNFEEDSEFGENISDVTELATPSDLSY
eukprot:gene978-293_t